MSSWPLVLGFIGVAALVGLILGRAWPVLLLLPPALGGLAWYGWEFDDVAGAYALIIAVLGYIGLAIGFALRRPWRRARRSLRDFEL